MAKIITNNVAAQIQDYVRRWKTVTGYKLATSSKGELLTIKTRPDARLMHLSGQTQSPQAMIAEGTVYVSETLIGRHEPEVKEFIIAHEIGHWVCDEDVKDPEDWLSKELGADRFAMSVFNSSTHMRLARQSLADILLVGTKKMVTVEPSQIPTLAKRMAVLAERIKHFN